MTITDINGVTKELINGLTFNVIGVPFPYEATITNITSTEVTTVSEFYDNRPGKRTVNNLKNNFANGGYVW